MPRKRKQKIELNNVNSLQGLIQETYNDACGQIKAAQDNITTLVNSTSAEDVEDATKISKAVTDALKIKDSAIKIKLEVSKLQNEIIKQHGNEAAALESMSGGKVGLSDFDKIRKFIEDGGDKIN